MTTNLSQQTQGSEVRKDYVKPKVLVLGSSGGLTQNVNVVGAGDSAFSVLKRS